MLSDLYSVFQKYFDFSELFFKEIHIFERFVNIILF